MKLILVNIRLYSCAADSKYVTDPGGLSDFAINSLKFYEEKTPFKRGIFSPTIKAFKLGYRMKNGVEADDSWSSSLLLVLVLIIILTVLLVKDAVTG